MKATALFIASAIAVISMPRQGRGAPIRPAVVARLDSIFAPFDRTDSPGCAVGVYRAGERVFAKGYGMANLEHGVPITPFTRFNVASVSRQFTVFAITLLAWFLRGSQFLCDSACYLSTYALTRSPASSCCAAI